MCKHYKYRTGTCVKGLLFIFIACRYREMYAGVGIVVMFSLE